MEIGDTKSLQKAVIAFCIFGGLLLVANCGSYYLGMYGFTISPFLHLQDGLWWRICDDARKSVGGAVAAAVATYLNATKRQDEKSDAQPNTSPDPTAEGAASSAARSTPGIGGGSAGGVVRPQRE
jgi:hypothetical protein